MLPDEVNQREIVQKALDLLSEHFDVAHVFVQVHRGDDETIGFEGGFGNFFARQMQISNWADDEIYSRNRSSAVDDDDDE